MTSVNKFLGQFFVKAHSLGVDAVVILADRQVQRPVDFGAEHIDLHLDVVHPLGLLNALFDHSIKRLLGVSLELGDVLALFGTRHARMNHAINRA